MESWESWKRVREMEVVPLSNVRRTEGPERGLGVRGLSRREFLRLAGVGAGAAAFPGLLAGCGGDQQQGNAPRPKSVEGKLTFWYWGESDAPGANQWMNETVKAYKEKKPDLEINVVPQSTATLISSFQAAASAGQRPGLAPSSASSRLITKVSKYAGRAVSHTRWDEK